MNRPRASGLRHITRIDHGRARGWWVRIYREGKCHSKFFGAATYGLGRGLELAVAWRERQLRQLPPARRGVHSTRPARVGHGYVRRAMLPRRASSTDCFVGWLRIEAGKARSTSYSTRAHGVAGARKKALAWLRREKRALRSRLSEAG